MPKTHQRKPNDRNDDDAGDDDDWETEISRAVHPSTAQVRLDETRWDRLTFETDNDKIETHKQKLCDGSDERRRMTTETAENDALDDFTAEFDVSRRGIRKSKTIFNLFDAFQENSTISSDDAERARLESKLKSFEEDVKGKAKNQIEKLNAFMRELDENLKV